MRKKGGSEDRQWPVSFDLRSPSAASIMPAATSLRAILPFRRFTLRVTCRRQVADQIFCGIVEFPSKAQHTACRGVKRFRQAGHSFARLVDLAPLDRDGLAEGGPNGLGLHLRTIPQ